MAEIVVRKGGKELSRIPIRAVDLTIGRGETNDIIIMSAAVSRKHARICNRDEGYLLEDLNSSSGSFVGGKRVTTHPLSHGEVVRIGDYELLFQDAPVARKKRGAGTRTIAGLSRVETKVLETPSLLLEDASGAAHPEVADPKRDARGRAAAPPARSQPVPKVPAPTPVPAKPAPTALADEIADKEMMDQSIIFDLSKHDIEGALLSPVRERIAGGDSDQNVSDRLNALFEISQTLDASRGLSGVLASIMDKAVAIMGAERGFLMLEDRNTHELEVHVARDKNGADIVGVDQEKVSRSLMRKVRELGKPILVLNAQSAEWGTKSILENQIHSALCAPLMTRDVVTGVIYVDHRSRAMAFSKQDVAFFTTFAIQAKAAIDNSSAYWELVDGLFKASDDFVVVCSPSGRIDQANLAGCALIGRPESEVLGRNLSDLVVEADRERANELCRHTIATGVVSARELLLPARDGREIPLSVSSFSLLDRSGDAQGLCIIGRDLTATKALIAELTTATENLERRNRFIKTTFGRYLSDEIVESVLDSPKGLKLGGESRKVTLLMSDVRGFTSLCERLEPAQVVGLLNTFYGEMVKVIHGLHGTIDEFIGDAIFAMFGAPITRPDDAERAAACAVAMQLAMTTVNELNRSAGLPDIEIGIGLHTGNVVVGNIGSLERMKYGVVGKDVNLTARIESYTTGGLVLISEAAIAEAGDHLEVGDSLPVEAKGLKKPILVYELRGVGGSYNLHLPEIIERFVPLERPIQVRYVVLEHKKVVSEPSPGTLIELSLEGGVLHLTDPVPPRRDVKLVIAGEEAEALAGDIYAKSLPGDKSEGRRVTLRFTSMPPLIKAYFRDLATAAPRGNNFLTLPLGSTAHTLDDDASS